MKHKQIISITLVAIHVLLFSLLMGCGMVATDPFEDGTEYSDAPNRIVETTAVTSEGATLGELTTEENVVEPTEESTTAPEPYEPIIIKQSLDEVKREVLVLYPGSGDGQVGYEDVVYREGPDSFSVEDGAIYILDRVNDRIIIYEEETYSYIDISDCSHPVYMNYQDGRIGIVDNFSKSTTVYKKDGMREVRIEFPEGLSLYTPKLKGIGETDIVWAWGENQGEKRYRYDWVTGVLEDMEYIPDKISVSVQGPYMLKIVGNDGNAVYYIHEDASALGIELKVNKENANGDIWYVELPYKEYYCQPRENVYLSKDGKLYIMECFGDRTVISELILGERP